MPATGGDPRISRGGLESRSMRDLSCAGFVPPRSAPASRQPARAPTCAQPAQPARKGRPVAAAPRVAHPDVKADPGTEDRSLGKGLLRHRTGGRLLVGQACVRSAGETVVRPGRYVKELERDNARKPMSRGGSGSQGVSFSDTRSTYDHSLPTNLSRATALHGAGHCLEWRATSDSPLVECGEIRMAVGWSAGRISGWRCVSTPRWSIRDRVTGR